MPIRDLNTLRFIWFNYIKHKTTQKSKSIVLLEYTKMQPVILAVSLLVRALTKKYRGTTFIAYTFRDNYKYYPHLKLIYKSFGVETHIKNKPRIRFENYLYRENQKKNIRISIKKVKKKNY